MYIYSTYLVQRNQLCAVKYNHLLWEGADYDKFYFLVIKNRINLFRLCFL